MFVRFHVCLAIENLQARICVLEIGISRDYVYAYKNINISAHPNEAGKAI